MQVECKKAQPKEVMSPTGSARGRSRVMPYGMDAFMLGIGMLGKLLLILAGSSELRMQLLQRSAGGLLGAALTRPPGGGHHMTTLPVHRQSFPPDFRLLVGPSLI